MKALTNLRERVNGNGQGAAERVRPVDVDVDVDPEEELVEVPYDVKLSRPMVDIGLRAGLWVAVGFGCVGGLLALLGLTGREGDTIIQEAPAGGDVPAPVARVAERAVEVWLTADSEDDPLLATLFVEQPALTISDGPDGSDLVVGRVTTVGGGQWEDGYWLVTAAVEVAECVPDSHDGWLEDEPGRTAEPAAERDVTELAGTSALAESLTCDDGEGAEGRPFADDRLADEPPMGEGGEDPGGDEDEVSGPSSPRTTTLFVEVGVVGDLGQRVAALTTPAIVAAPTAASPEWEPTGRGAEPPEAGEPVARTVEEFLRAWLAGDGDTSRHVAPHVVAPPVRPAPFTTLVLTEIAYSQEDAGQTGVRAFVEATTPGGAMVGASYELTLTFREDRWEVTDYWGAPSLAGRPTGEESDGAPDGTVDDGATGDGGAEDDS